VAERPFARSRLGKGARTVASQLQHHLRELQNAEARAERGRKLVDQQRERAHRLRNADDETNKNANVLLGVLEDAQKQFEGYIDMIERKIAAEQ